MIDVEMNRRAFARGTVLAVLAALVPGRSPLAALLRTDLHIGAVLPDGAALRGVRFGAAEAGHAARLFRSGFALHEARPGTDDARRLIEDEGVHVLIGGAAAAETDALMALAEDAGVLFMNVGTPMDKLARACSAHTFHIVPSNAMRAAARRAANASSDARVVGWHASLSRFGAAQVTDRYRDAFDADLDEPGWAGWMAVKIVFDAAQRAGTAEAAALAAFLTSPRAVFDGHKGMQLSFTPDTHQLRQPLYVLEGDDVVAEIPTTRALGERTHAELLDTIGIEGGPGCAS